METNKIILHGGGEHSRVVVDCLLDNNKEVIAIFDPKYVGQRDGIEMPGSYRSDLYPHLGCLVAIGDNKTRKRAAEVTSHPFVNTVHNSAIVSTRTRIGVGNMILHGAIIQSGAVLENHIIVNTGAQVDHDCHISSFVHVAPGAVLCGMVRVGEGVLIGAGAVVLPGISIGNWATIGAGAVVISDVPPFVTVAGNPARTIASKQST